MQYRLTRRCLSELATLGIETMVATKGETDLIRRDIDIYNEFGGSLAVLLGFSRLRDRIDIAAVIRINFPRLLEEYHRLLNTGAQPYYGELVERYGPDDRLTFLFRGA